MMRTHRRPTVLDDVRRSLGTVRSVLNSTFRQGHRTARDCTDQLARDWRDWLYYLPPQLTCALEQEIKAGRAQPVPVRSRVSWLTRSLRLHKLAKLQHTFISLRNTILVCLHHSRACLDSLLQLLLPTFSTTSDNYASSIALAETTTTTNTLPVPRPDFNR